MPDLDRYSKLLFYETVNTLARKYEVSPYIVRDILRSEGINSLRDINWKDLDVVVQEGLVDLDYRPSLGAPRTSFSDIHLGF